MALRIAAQDAEAALENAPAFLTIIEVAELARIHERTVRRAIADGRLACVRRGRRGILIPKAALLKFLILGVS